MRPNWSQNLLGPLEMRPNWSQNLLGPLEIIPNLSSTLTNLNTAIIDCNYKRQGGYKKEKATRFKPVFIK